MSSNGFADAQGPGEDVFSRARALKTKTVDVGEVA